MKHEHKLKIDDDQLDYMLRFGADTVIQAENATTRVVDEATSALTINAVILASSIVFLGVSIMVGARNLQRL